MISTKRGLADVWPIKKKTFFVLVDPENITTEDGAPSSIPTLLTLVAKKAKVIVATSFGTTPGIPLNAGDKQRDSGAKLPDDLSAAPLLEKLQSMLQTTVKFAPDSMNAAAEVKALQPGEVLLLENLRQYRSEASPSAEERSLMAEVLASYCDVFVNDSFATAHELKCSSVALPKKLRHGAAGLLMEKELAYFKRLLTHPARPTAVVVAGSHIEEKLRLMLSLIGKVDRILVAGEVALPFLAAKGLPTGKGFDPNTTVTLGRETIRAEVLATRILKQALASGVSVVLPVDHVTHNEFQSTRNPFVTLSAGVPSELYALDVGPATVQLFSQEIRSCRTVFWSGTLGVASLAGYEEGTESFAKLLAASGVFSVVGGRDTTRCVRHAGVAQSMSHLCSGGVSCLEVLQANLLPGVEALTDAVGELDETNVATVNELLRHLPLFCGCTSQQLSVIAKKAVRRVYNAGDFLIYDGDRFSSMFVVAKGTLLACPKSAYGSSTAVRRVVKGHAIGLYEFVTLHTSTETVQASDHDTVVYQLSHAALNLAMSESPELGAQLVVNLSEPLRVIANIEHSTRASASAVTCDDLRKSRAPTFLVSGTDGGFIPDAVNDVVASVALHKLSLLYRPFESESGTCMMALPFDGLLARILFVLSRSFLFHRSISTVGPTIAAAVSSMVTTPVRLLAMGKPLHKLTVEEVVDQSLISGSLALAPLASHALFVRLREKAEAAQRKPLASAAMFLLEFFCRASVGIVAFPLVARRGMDLLTLRSFVAYLAKHAFALVLEALVRRVLSRSQSR